MENKHPTSQDIEAYQKVNDYLNNKVSENKDNSFSLFPKPTWVWVIIIAVVTFLSYYGLTVLLFGEDFWVYSLIGE